MIKLSSEMLTEMKEQMRGGKGTIEITHIMNQSDLKGKARLCAKITIHPGYSLGITNMLMKRKYIILSRARGL